MMKYFQIMEDAQLSDLCGGLGPIVAIIKKLVTILHIVIPIALIALGTFDLGKAVMASDDKQIKEAQGKLIKRCVYAVLVFLIPYLVGLIMSLVDVASKAGAKDTTIGDKSETSYSECWNKF